MILKNRGICLAATAVGLLLSAPADAWAYVDPGTGSYLFQIAAAGFVAGVLALRRYWDAVKSRFGGHTRRSANKSNSTSAPE